MDKKWTRITETGGLTCDADMLSVYKETENFENIKDRIVEALLKDRRYENYDIEKVKTEIKNTERNEEDYYIWNVGGKPYRVGLLLEVNTTANTRYKQVGQRAKIKTVLYLPKKVKTEK